LHRPGGGTGGTPFDVDNFDPFDATPRQTFVHWDARFLAWLERSGYQVDCCTDVDLHREGLDVVRPYRLLLSAGHDEYWTDAMRAAVEAHIDAGGNAAFFGGNTCWWRTVFDGPTTFRRAHQWSDPAKWSDPAAPGEPEKHPHRRELPQRRGAGPRRAPPAGGIPRAARGALGLRRDRVARRRHVR